MSELRDPFDERVNKLATEVSEKGWVHYATGIEPNDTVAVHALFKAMAQRLSTDSRKEPEISIIKPREGSKVLASSHQEMSFHTDNVYLEDPCRSVALFCAVQAEEGGGNDLVDGLAVVRELPMEIQGQLSEQKWQWASPTTEEPSEEFSVFDDEQERIRWWRKSLLNRDMASVAIADVFEQALNNSIDRQSVLMQPGDVLVTDNTRFLHNRSAFIGERRIYRARFW